MGKKPAATRCTKRSCNLSDFCALGSSADDFVNAVFCRELLRVLNRGEAVNALKRAIYASCEISCAQCINEIKMRREIPKLHPTGTPYTSMPSRSHPEIHRNNSGTTTGTFGTKIKATP